MKAPAKPKSIDDYLARIPADRRRALMALRATIHGLLPGVEECISYSMPAFRHEGHVVAGFLATAKGCSYFPFSGTTLAILAADVGAYDRTKSALQFDPERSLSKALVKKLLLARLAELSGTAKLSRPRPAQRAASSLGRPKTTKRSPKARRVGR